MDLKKYMNADFFSENVDKNCKVIRPVEDREYWDRFKGACADILKEGLVGWEDAYDILPLSKHILFSKTGDRMSYQAPREKRHLTLARFAFLEAIENKGEHFDKVLDLLWAVLEETEWAIPAHQKYGGGDSIVPCEYHRALDLGCGSASSLVTEVYAIFRKKFDEISPEIGNRIKRRIREDVYLNFINNDYRWMGFGRIPNNWNPDVTNAVLENILHLEEYGELEFKVLARCVYIINKYYEAMPLDGGCDEGASYWEMAGANLALFAGEMKKLTKGALDMTVDEKIINISLYTVNMFNNHKYCISFSDSAAKTTNDWALTYKIGKIINNQKLLSYAKARYNATKDIKSAILSAPTFHICGTLEACAEIRDLETEEFSLPESHRFDSIKVMLEREKTTAPFGLVLAAKANHNKESHNHLDTGSFVVFKNCQPFLVDPGHKVYTAQTFSNRRYEIWNTQSQFHNLPIIGGCGQKPGREFEAENVVFENSSMKADLQKAYGEDFIEKYTREITLDRENSKVVVKECFSLTEEKEIEFVFITAAPHIEIKDKILLVCNGETLEITADKPFKATVEPIIDDDARIEHSWGKNALSRIKVKMKLKEDTVKFEMR